MIEGKNQKAKSYCCSFLEAGLAGYDNEKFKILLSDEAISNFAHTFNGDPVYIHHLGEPECDSEIVGYVSTIEKRDSWWWANFIVYDEKAQVLLDENKWLISCAYDITKSDKGGKHNGIKYDAEVLDGVFDHLAIVPNPRYEDVQVIQNSDKETMIKEILSKLKMGKILNSIIVNSEDDSLGNEITGKKLIDPKLINFDEEVEVDGQPVKTANYMNMLNSAYNEYLAKNAEKPEPPKAKNDSDDAEPPKDKKPKNDDDSDDKAKEQKMINSITEAVLNSLKNSDLFKPAVQNSNDKPSAFGQINQAYQQSQYSNTPVVEVFNPNIERQLGRENY